MFFNYFSLLPKTSYTKYSLIIIPGRRPKRKTVLHNVVAELRAEGLLQAQVPPRRISAGTWGPSMESNEMKDRKERAGLDSPERAPVTDDGPGDAPDERVVGSPWWEGGSRPEAEAEKEPDTYRGAEYIYRGVRYGEPKSQPPEEPDDDDPVDMSVLAVMSEDQPAVPPPEGQEPGEPGGESSWWEGGSRPEEKPDAGVESSWWEGGSRPEETAGEEPDAGVGEVAPDAPYLYSETAYGEPVPEAESQPPEELNDHDEPADMSVPAALSEDQPAVPPAEGGKPRAPVVEAPWWPQEAAEEEPDAGVGEAAPGAPRTYSGAAYTYRGVSYGESVPGPESRPPEEPDDDDPVDLSVLAVMSEDQPTVPPAEGEEPRAPVVEAPWWPQATAEEETDAGVGEVAPGEPYLYSGTVYGESIPEPESQPPEKPDVDDEPTDLSVPAVMSEDRPAVPPAERGEEHVGEDSTGDRGEADRRPSAWPAGIPAATEALPEGPPGELIRSIVAEVCPDELLLVGTAQAPLPEWAPAAVTAARNDLDRRLAERKPVDASEHLRLAIVENVMGLHDEADTHLKEALPRSDRFGPVLNALAVTSLARGKVAPAIVYCKEALRETGGDDSVRAAASSNLGDLYRLQGNTEQAAEAYETAIQCLGPQGESRRLSRLHLRLGRLYRHLGQTDKARQHLSDSVRLFKGSGDEVGHVQSLAELGSALTESGLHDLALRNVEDAVRICLRTGDKPGAALVQAELGVIYMAQDQLTRALAYLESAVSLHRELGNRGGEAATLSNMGKIHDSRGDVDEARRFYQAALEINRELGHEVGEAKRLPHLESGDQEGARAKLLKAEEIFSRAGSAEQQEDARRMTESTGGGIVK